MSFFKFKKLNLFYKFNQQDFIGIEFSNNVLKLVHLKSFFNKNEILELLSKDLSGLEDSEISKLIRESFQDLKKLNPSVILVIPTNLVITKNIEIPSTNPNEIKDIVNLQAGRHTPYSREEIIVDYLDILTYKNSYTKILLVIGVRNIIKKQIDIIERAGLKLEQIVFSAEGICSYAPKILKQKKEVLPFIILHISDGFTEFIVSFNNKPIFIRNIPIGRQHLILEKEKFLSKFIEELKKSLEAYNSEDIARTPIEIVLVGSLDNLFYIETSLNESLNLEVKFLDYTKEFSFSQNAPGTLKKSNFSFFDIITSVLNYSNLKVNLITEEIKLRKIIEERGRELIKTGILLLTFIVLFTLTLFIYIYFKSSYLKKLEQEYKNLILSTKEIESDFNKVSAIKKYLSLKGYSLETLGEIYNVIPEDLQINDIRYDESGRFSVRGISETMSSIFSFVDSLERSKYFKEVKTRYATKRKEGLKDIVDFEVGCFLENK